MSRLASEGGFTQNPVPAYSPSTVTVRFENRLTCSGMLSHSFRERPFSRVRLALWSYWVDVHWTAALGLLQITTHAVSWIWSIPRNYL